MTVTDLTERIIETPDGRVLAVQESGDPAGRPVLVHMGTPNSRHLYGPNQADAAARGLRLICYDRPGYGGSTPQPGRTHADCAADVRTICASLQIDRIGIWGSSGGGAPARAWAARLPDLAVGVASLAGLAPWGAEGLDWFDGMGQDNVDDFKLYLKDKAASRAKMEKDREEFLAASADDMAKSLKTLLTSTDAAVLTGDLAEYLAFSGHEGLAPGSEGWWGDCCARSGCGRCERHRTRSRRTTVTRPVPTGAARLRGGAGRGMTAGLGTRAQEPVCRVGGLARKRWPRGPTAGGTGRTGAAPGPARCRTGCPARGRSRSRWAASARPRRGRRPPPGSPPARKAPPA